MKFTITATGQGVWNSLVCATTVTQLPLTTETCRHR